jgi:hypothetical protein
MTNARITLPVGGWRAPGRQGVDQILDAVLRGQRATDGSNHARQYDQMRDFAPGDVTPEQAQWFAGIARHGP